MKLEEGPGKPLPFFPSSPGRLDESAEGADGSQSATGCETGAAHHLGHLQIPLLFGRRLQGIDNTEAIAQTTEQRAAAESAQATTEAAAAADLLVNPVLGATGVEPGNLVDAGTAKAAQTVSTTSSTHRAHLLLDPVLGAAAIETRNLIQALLETAAKAHSATAHLSHLLINPRSIAQSTHSHSHLKSPSFRNLVYP